MLTKLEDGDRARWNVSGCLEWLLEQPQAMIDALERAMDMGSVTNWESLDIFIGGMNRFVAIFPGIPAHVVIAATEKAFRKATRFEDIPGIAVNEIKEWDYKHRKPLIDGIWNMLVPEHQLERNFTWLAHQPLDVLEKLAQGDRKTWADFVHAMYNPPPSPKE